MSDVDRAVQAIMTIQAKQRRWKVGEDGLPHPSHRTRAAWEAAEIIQALLDLGWRRPDAG